MQTRNALLEVTDLSVAFRQGKEMIPRVDGVNLKVYPGEIVCLVGESGCGKSVTALACMGLLPRQGRITGGSIRFEGCELTGLDEDGLDQVRGSGMAMIFQDVMNSLNPVLPIGLQMTEGAVRRGMDRARAREKAISLLERVGVPDPAGTLRRFPHQLSGGQRQRVMIAMALMGDPRLLIADEPTTALDMTVQRQILQLLRTLQQDGLSVLLITHDMGVVAELADRVAVMYAGQCVEEAPCAALLQHPRHPYTQALLKAVPGMADPRDRQLYAIPGSVPQRYDRMEGCRFAPRCPHGEACSREAACRETAGGYVRCSLDAAQ